MYAYQVIEDLEFLKTQPVVMPDMVDKVIQLIKNAHHFHFNTAQDVISTINPPLPCPLFMDKQGEFITPPYDKCWFDFDFDPVGHGVFTKIAYIFYQVHPKFIIALPFIKHITGSPAAIAAQGRWLPFAFSFLIGLGTDFAEYPYKEVIKITNPQDLFCQFGNIFPSIHLKVYLKDFQRCQESLDLCQEGAQNLAYLNFALMLINCQNIKTIKNTPSQPFNKSRRKKGKTELFTYHTLKLILPGYRSHEPSDIDIKDLNKIDKRLHFCRGHFKTYTNERPLFGKYTGRFWWPSQIKGNKEKGLVLKNYSVEPKTE